MEKSELVHQAKRLVYSSLCKTSISETDGTLFYTCPIWRGTKPGVFTIDHPVGLSYRVGYYEPEVTQVMGNYVMRGDTVLDVGAHAGYLSLYLSRLVGPEGKVFSIEPTPRSREMIARNLKDNNTANIEVFPYAMSDKSGYSRFVVDKSSYENKLVNSGADEGQTLCVQTTTIDDFTDLYNLSPTFIKVDVEGAELAVLKGSCRILKNKQPIVVAEIRDYLWDSVRNLMESHYYNYKIISKAGSDHCRRGTPNVLFTPK